MPRTSIISSESTKTTKDRKEKATANAGALAQNAIFVPFVPFVERNKEDRMDHPELRRLLDEHERVTFWPVKKKNKQRLILEYLASKFEVGRYYTEKEVNALLTKFHTFNDYALLRRYLVDYGFLNRKRDCSAYWKVDLASNVETP